MIYLKKLILSITSYQFFFIVFSLFINNDSSATIYTIEEVAPVNSVQWIISSTGDREQAIIGDKIDTAKEYLHILGAGTTVYLREHGSEESKSYTVKNPLRLEMTELQKIIAKFTSILSISQNVGTSQSTSCPPKDQSENIDIPILAGDKTQRLTTSKTPRTLAFFIKAMDKQSIEIILESPSGLILANESTKNRIWTHKLDLLPGRYRIILNNSKQAVPTRRYFEVVDESKLPEIPELGKTKMDQKMIETVFLSTHISGVWRFEASLRLFQAPKNIEGRKELGDALTKGYRFNDIAKVSACLS